MTMNLLLLLALAGQFRHDSSVASPPPSRHASAVAEPFVPQVVPVEWQPAVTPTVLPDLPLEVFAPEPPRRRVIRVASQEAEKAPEPGIRKPVAAEDVSAALAPVLNEIRDSIQALSKKLTPPSTGYMSCECQNITCEHCHPSSVANTPPRKAACPFGCTVCTNACAYPGACGHPGCGPSLQPTVAKQWFNLTNEPGTQGYGALVNGEVVVEQRRPKPVAAPVASYSYPLQYIQPNGGGISGGVLGGSCAGGACGMPSNAGRGGLFGGFFR